MLFTVNPIDGVRISYREEGAGEPLILLHGSGGSSRFWDELGYVDALKDHVRLILVDARGHGRSDKPTLETAYAMERFVSDIVAVMDDLALDSAHYFGYSMGGRIAFGLGAYAPDRFRSLVIGGGSYQVLPGWFDLLIFDGAVDTIATEGMKVFLDRWEQHLGTPLPDPVREVYLDNDPLALAAYLRASDRDPDYEAALGTMTMPVLLFAGDNDVDRLAPSRIAAERLAQGRLLIIPGANHVSALAHRELIVPAVLDMLAMRQLRPSPRQRDDLPHQSGVDNSSAA